MSQVPEKFYSNRDKYHRHEYYKSTDTKPGRNTQKTNDDRKRKYSDPDEWEQRPKKHEKDKRHDWGSRNNSSTSKTNSSKKDKPNFETTGKLTEDTNKFRGVIIKYSEPPEARKPKRRWRLYPFKQDKELPVLYIHRQSGYLLGRDRKIADIPLDHPSCSKQHAALQYRLLPFTKDDGVVIQRIRPYLMDLESANGTFINNKKIEPRRYYELLEKDVVKFGFSSREYVVLHESSKDSDDDDNVKEEDV